MSTNTNSTRLPATTSLLHARHGRGVVPYIVSWSSEERLPGTVIERGRFGIGYADEILLDRDKQGVLWQRTSVSPGQGRPLFGQLHPVRQRRAMSRLLCGICGGPPDQNEQGTLWLIHDFREDWPGWPEHMAEVEPPVCLPCAHLSVRACPSLRQSWVAVRVGQAPVSGVRGVRYRGGHILPTPAGEATVAFEDPAIRWILAAQLVRELTDCTVTELE